jgi:putative membrane protein
LTDKISIDREGDEPSIANFIPRGLLGGTLMGLANLVPGISGGTMLLAVGVYPSFINAIADLTVLRFKPRPLIVLATIAGAATLAIGLLAGPTRALVIEERPLMYSFFIGLTLGGLPLVWRLAQPVTRSVWVGAAVAFALMVVMAFGTENGNGTATASMPLLVLSGLAGASAMILPGISGGYLLLLLGQYEPILGAIDELKQGLIGPAGLDQTRILASMDVVIPVGIGVVLGVVGVSNLLRWLLDRYEKPTLGVLLGLLLGAVVGLYPFQAPVPPELGFEDHGRPVPEAELVDVPEEDWPLERFTPTSGELAASGGTIAMGLLLTFAISRFGSKGDDRSGLGHD